MFKNTFRLSLLRHSAFNIQHDRMLCTMPPASVCRFMLINSKDAGENSQNPGLESHLPSLACHQSRHIAHSCKKTDIENWVHQTLRRNQEVQCYELAKYSYLANKRPGEEAKWANSIASVTPSAICKHILKIFEASPAQIIINEKLIFPDSTKTTDV